MDRETRWRQQRGTLVGVMLFGMLAAGAIAFSVLACGGFAIGAMIVVLALFALGLLNYLLWGRSFTNEMADEFQAEERRRRLEAEAWPSEEDEPDHPRF
jgi:hypothetical protein